MTSPFLRPVRIVAIVALLGVAAGAWWVWNSARSSTAASSADAIEQYRAADAPVSASVEGAPEPGVYRFRVSGREAAGSGVLSADRALPSEAVYVITPTADGYHEDLRFSKEHVEEARFRVTDEGPVATWRRTKVTFLGLGTDDRNDVVPPSLDHPSELGRGDRWSGTYRLGELEVSYRARVVSTGTAEIDGRQVETATFRTESTYAGPTPGERTDVVTWAPELSLPLSWTIEQSTGGSAEFTMSAEMELVSATPER